MKTIINFICAGLILQVFLLAGTSIVHAVQEPQHIYVTREGSEPDRGASAWLIKRFIDPQAQFRLFTQDEPIPEGIAFDIPESHYRRTHRYSTYETLLHAHRITEPVVLQIGIIIHDLEINTWGKRATKEAERVEIVFSEIQRSFGRHPIPMDCHLAFFDHLADILSKNILDSLSIPNSCQTKILE